MSRIASALLIALLSLSAYAADDAKKIYAEDTAKVKAGDLNFDWFEYRKAAYGNGTEYFDWHPVRAKFQKQIQVGDTNGALKSAQEIIDHNMANPEGHLLALSAYIHLNDQAKRAQEFAIVQAWVDSLRKSGDGTSEKTAIVVVEVEEEYILMGAIMGLGMPESQSLVHKDGHSYDLMKVNDQDGKPREIWFNVDISMNKFADALGAANKK